LTSLYAYPHVRKNAAGNCISGGTKIQPVNRQWWCYNALAVTMKANELLKDRREDILRVAAQHGAQKVRVFGSAARGDDGPDSDLDFLVEFEEGRSLLDVTALWQDLEELLGRKVDIVEPEGLHWYIRDRVLREALPL